MSESKTREIHMTCLGKIAYGLSDKGKTLATNRTIVKRV